MFAGHKIEKMILEEYYKRPGNPVLLLYGRKGIGKTTLVREFAKGNPCFYYEGADCCEREQLRLLQEALKWQLPGSNPPEDFIEGLEMLLELPSEGKKMILVLDECERIIKNSKTFVDGLLKLLEEQKGKSSFMLLLLTSDCTVVEDEKNQEMERLKKGLTRVVPMKPYQYADIVSSFPHHTTKDNIILYSILGGIPAYLKLWDTKEDIKSNIIRLFLEEEGALRHEAENYLKQYLRELSSYNSVLTAMAAGNVRLHDLYNRTGFSRAKASVYIKNLMQIGVTRKIQIYGPEKKDAALKGLYEIAEPFLSFWYRFVFPNESALAQGKAEWVYDTRIAPYLEEYLQKGFIMVCEQFMQLMNRFQKLPVEINSLRPWYGEGGYIPMMATDDKGHLIICFCKWAEEPFDERDLEKELRYLLETGFEPDYYFLFSKSGFSQSLAKKAGMVKTITLIDLEDF